MVLATRTAAAKWRSHRTAVEGGFSIVWASASEREGSLLGTPQTFAVYQAQVASQSTGR